MNVILLDIDGPLNSYLDYERIEEFVERDKITDKRVSWDERNLHCFQDEMGVRFFDSRNNNFAGGHGDFVDNIKAERLSRLARETDSVIVGISSWFGYTAGLSEFDYIKRIGDFLDVDIVEIGPDTSGGEGRVRGVVQWCLINQPERVLVIDDQKYHYLDYGCRKIWLDLPREGFTEEMYEEAKAILTGPMMQFQPVGNGMNVELVEIGKDGRWKCS